MGVDHQLDLRSHRLPHRAYLYHAGLDPPSLRAANPRLVYVAISGYGHSGPKAGRGGYELFDPDMHATALKRLTLETELRRAVERKGLFGRIFAGIGHRLGNLF